MSTPTPTDAMNNNVLYFRDQVKDNIRTMYGDGQIWITSSRHGKPKQNMGELFVAAVYRNTMLLYYKEGYGSTLNVLKELLQELERELAEWEKEEQVKEKVEQWKVQKKHLTSLPDQPFKEPKSLEFLEEKSEQTPKLPEEEDETDGATLCGP